MDDGFESICLDIVTTSPGLMVFFLTLGFKDMKLNIGFNYNINFLMYPYQISIYKFLYEKSKLL